MAWFRRTFPIATAIVLVASGGCATEARVAPRPDCSAPEIAAWTLDSAAALCLPPGWRRLGDYRFGTPRADSPVDDWFTLHVLAWPAESASISGWPPRLESTPSCQLHCSTAENVRVYLDTIDARVARIETGIVTGGNPSLHRKPMLKFGWVVNDDYRVFGLAIVEHPASLDTVRRVLRSVRVGAAAN